VGAPFLVAAKGPKSAPESSLATRHTLSNGIASNLLKTKKPLRAHASQNCARSLRHFGVAIAPPKPACGAAETASNKHANAFGHAAKLFYNRPNCLYGENGKVEHLTC
jgi:hypothetical protein